MSNPTSTRDYALAATGAVTAIYALRIDYPSNLIMVTWALIGFFYARAFGKKIDYEIQQTPTYQNLNPFIKYIVNCLLDATHHLWIGLLIMIRFGPEEIIYHLGWPLMPYWIGWGIFIDDLPDVPGRFREYFAYLMPETT